jgi:hypothetical protein
MEGNWGAGQMLSIAVSIFIFAGLTSLPSLVNQMLRERTNS